MPDYDTTIPATDDLGNQAYPAVDETTVYEKAIYDAMQAGLIEAITKGPSTASNDIQPEVDVEALILRSFAAGVSAILEIYDKNGARTNYFDADGVYHSISAKNVQLDLINTNAAVSAGGAGIVFGRDDGAAEDVDSRLGFVLFKGNNGSQLRNTAGFTAHADENWAVGANGTRFAIETVPNGSASRSDAFAITGEQVVQALQNTLHATKSFAHGVATFTTTASLDKNQTVALCDTGSGAFTLTLPAASGCTDRLYRIKKKSGDVNVLTVDGNGAETIDGQTTILLATPYESIDVVSDGSNWFIL